MIIVTFTQEELNALGTIIVAGTKAQGDKSYKAAWPLIVKLEAAVAETNKKEVTND